MKKVKPLCRLLPYRKREFASSQQLSENLGWGVSNFNLPEAWKVSMGEGVTIGVVDSGCQLDHCDLKNNILQGFNFVDKKKDPDDDNDHGTHITGIICAERNNIGIVGVAPKAKVRPIKVLDENGNGEIRNVVKGIRWAIQQKVDFISISLGINRRIPSLQKVIREADATGIIVFAAAGNIGKAEHLLYPANFEEPISIGAIDKSLRRADFSNTGHHRYLDFMAPGVDILSTVPHNWWAVLSGSSMAQPYVCGLAALLLSYKRNIGLDIELNCASDYRKFFKDYTIDVIGKKFSGDPFYQGFGIITVNKLLDKMRERHII